MLTQVRAKDKGLIPDLAIETLLFHLASIGRKGLPQDIVRDLHRPWRGTWCRWDGSRIRGLDCWGRLGLRKHNESNDHNINALHRSR